MRSRLSAEGRAYAVEWSDEVLAVRMADLYRSIVSGYSGENAADFNLSRL